VVHELLPFRLLPFCLLNFCTVSSSYPICLDLLFTTTTLATVACAVKFWWVIMIKAMASSLASVVVLP